jgi:HEAT repeat protein
MTKISKAAFAMGALCLVWPVARLGASPPIAAIAPSNADRARAILREGLSSKDFRMRIEAISALGMVGRNETLIRRLEDSLHDKNVEVRLAGVRALADLKSSRSEQALRETMETDSVPEVSFAAAIVLARWQNREAIDFLTAVYEGKRKSKSDLLRQGERSFFDEFHSFRSGMMYIVGWGIGYVPVPAAGAGFSALTMLLKDPQVSNRAQVLLILGRRKNAASIRLLRGALQDRDWSVRAVAAQMISQTAQTELQNSLLPLLTDENQKVRLYAAGAYLHLLSVGEKR